MKFSIAVAVLMLAALLVSQPKPREQVGPLMNGGALVPNGSVVRPAGTQVALDTMPMSSVLSVSIRACSAFRYGAIWITAAATAGSPAITRRIPRRRNGEYEGWIQGMPTERGRANPAWSSAAKLTAAFTTGLLL